MSIPPIQPPPRTNDPQEIWKWMFEVWRSLVGSGLLSWDAVGKAGSDIHDLAAIVHTHQNNAEGGTVDHTVLTTIGTNTHVQIDAHLAATSDVHGIGAGNNVVGTGTNQVLTAKTIDGDNNTVQDLLITVLKTVLANASNFLSFNALGAPIATKAVPSGVVVGTTDTQTLSNKTLTDPVVDGSKLYLDYDIDIKLGNVATNDFGWEDILGPPHIRSPGGSDPTWAAYQGNIWQFRFSNVATNEMWFELHIPHSYALGTDLYIHVHWSCNAVPTGNVKWSFELSYAKGHNQQAFPAAVSTSVTQASSGTQYQHMLAETVITDDGTALIDRADIEPDGIILVRLFRDPTDAADTLDQTPFLHFCDLHFQKSRFSTKNKAPNFYA